MDHPSGLSSPSPQPFPTSFMVEVQGIPRRLADPEHLEAFTFSPVSPRRCDLGRQVLCLICFYNPPTSIGTQSDYFGTVFVLHLFQKMESQRATPGFVLT